MRNAYIIKLNQFVFNIILNYLHGNSLSMHNSIFFFDDTFIIILIFEIYK